MQYMIPRALIWALPVLGVFLAMIPLSAENDAMQFSDITQLKALHRDTLISENGQPRAVIVVPAGDSYRRLAEKVRDAVRSAGGGDLPIRADGGFADRYGKLVRAPETNVVLIGSLETSKLAAHLYAFRYHSVDALYPGKGGYVVQTVCDPWGNGSNVVLLGGSDAAGIARAVDRFCSKLPRGETINIPNAPDLQFSPDTAARFSDLTADPTDQQIAERVKAGDKAFREGVHCGLFPQIVSAGLMYMRSGREGYARLFRAMIFLADDLYHQDLGTYGGPWGMDADFSFADLICAWDVVEESPSLSSEDRLRITNIILEYIRYWETYWSVKPVFEEDIRSNHTTFTSLGFFYAADYFGKYYHLPQAEQWRRLADGCFAAQGKSFKPQEDSNSYQWITLTHMLRYALANSDQRYLTSGNARIGGDLAIMTMDNLGYQVSFGDVGGFTGGTQEMYIWRPLAAITGEGRYSWAANKGLAVRTATGFNAYINSVPPAEPTDLLGVKWLPTDPLFYKHWNGQGIVPQEKTFEKLTFRTSFDPQAPYLILDGISGCGHGHQDGNSILRLTDRGRIWLADCDYIKAQPKFHNTLTLFRDGQSFGLPAFSELELAADLESVGISRTTTPGLSGTDWSRTIVWDKGHEFVVVDEVRAQVADEFSLRCNWHTLGTPELEGSTFKVTQGGPSMTIRNLDGASLRFWNDASLGKNWSTYTQAEPVIHILQQVRTERLKAGDRVYMLNVLSTQSEGQAPVHAERASESSLLTGEGDSRTLIGINHDEAEVVPGIRTDARVYVVSRERIALGSATKLSIGGRTMFAAGEPVSAETRAGGGMVFSAQRPVTIQVLREGRMTETELQVGRTEVGDADVPADLGVILPEPQAPREASQSLADLGTGKLSPVGEFESESKSLISLAAGPEGIYVGDADGKVRALSLDGAPRWEFDAGSEVRALWTGRLDRDAPPVIAVGTRESAVILLDQAGRQLWWQELPFYKRLASVVYFSAADLKGDGNRALIAGSENWHHYAFDSKGAKVWQYESIHGSTAGTAVDLDGDGRQEVIAGTEYYWWHAVNPDGRKRWQYASKTGPRTTCVVAVTAPKPMVFFGGADGNIHALDAGGSLRWQFNTGDEITGLALGDLDGDGSQEIIAGSLSFNICAVKQDGTRLWRRDLGEPVTALAQADLSGDGIPETCAATESGRIVALDRSGKTLAEWRAEGSVRRLCPIPGSPARLAVLMNDRLVVLGM